MRVGLGPLVSLNLPFVFFNHHFSFSLGCVVLPIAVVLVQL